MNTEEIETSARGPRIQGFTLVEIMIVVAIIGLLAAMALPGFRKARSETIVARTVNDFRIFGDAFATYAMERGRYPADAHILLPSGMEAYIKPSQWAKCPIGGSYNWEGPSWGESGSYPYAGIALFECPASVATFKALDAKIDDGNLATGVFRLMSNGRYTYVIEE